MILHGQQPWQECGHWPEGLYRIHEVPIGTLITLELGLSTYRPHEKARLEQAGRDGTGFDEEFELRLASGVTKSTRTIAEAEIIDGVPARISGITQDVAQLRAGIGLLMIDVDRLKKTKRTCVGCPTLRPLSSLVLSQSFFSKTGDHFSKLCLV